MANSISQLSESAETAGIRVWEQYAAADVAERLSRRQFLRDPLKKCQFRSQDIVAVFGYTVDDSRASLVYFWEQNLQSLRWTEAGPATGNPRSEYLLYFGWLLAQVHSQNPTMKKFMNFFEQKIVAADPKAPKLFKDLNLYWCRFERTKFACLYKERSAPGEMATPITSSASLLECLAFHNDYFHYRSPIWQAVPMSYLSKSVNGETAGLERIHLHPKCFNPFDTPALDQFLWPWQRCIEPSESPGHLRYRPIETSSLVFDVRRSTIAMEQLPSDELGNYSPFINKIVETAVRVVFDHGGFFDKETGDGIVAHFLDLDDALEGQATEKSNKRAFQAAVEIVRQTSVICDNFQADLKFGISQLGGGVGLHTGPSVWVSELNQIRAIGESVVVASRLCSEAGTRSIFVSNSFYRDLTKNIRADISTRFQRKTYQGKEYKGDPGLFGYELCVEDSF